MKVLNPFEAMEVIDAGLIAAYSHRFRASCKPIFMRFQDRKGNVYTVVFGDWFTYMHGKS